MNPVHIAIVIPVYNASQYISDCLDSVIAQTYQDWEAICVDDGSTDNSAEILKRYSAKDPRIKTFSKKNGGASSARNLALSKIDSSPSTWISFVDSDDFILPTMYADIVEVLNEANDGDIDYIKLKSKRVSDRISDRQSTSSSDVKHFEYQVFNRGGYFKNGNIGGLIASLFVKSSIIKENKLSFPTEMRILEDQVLSLQCAMLSKKIMVFNKANYLYYTNPESLTETRNNCSDDIVRCINHAYRILCNQAIPEADEYFHKSYMPIKVSLLLGEIMRYGYKPSIDIDCGLDLSKYVKGMKSVIKYYIHKFRKII